MKNNLENDQLLRKIHKSPESSQRDLAYDLGFSLGKLNYCLRELKNKGLVKIKVFKIKKIKFLILNICLHLRV